jgi:hypothetical protein
MRTVLSQHSNNHEWCDPADHPMPFFDEPVAPLSNRDRHVSPVVRRRLHSQPCPRAFPAPAFLEIAAAPPRDHTPTSATAR